MAEVVLPKTLQVDLTMFAALVLIAEELAKKDCRKPLSSLGGEKNCTNAHAKDPRAWNDRCLPCQAREALGLLPKDSKWRRKTLVEP